ncbi:tryptophan--tRNA ligase [bacterium]|nr:tryptophan--tRNA ligase [bacterium]
MKQRIMSGMRPTGKLHLGHYLGVIDNWVKLQDEYDCYFSVADWHALTTKYDKTENLRNDILDVVMDWLACGIDPDKATIYVQSLVPETAELHIYLSMITPQNWVERDPTLKDMAKILKTKEGMGTQINYGLMGYPVLMTADILTFNADLVPVGIDQVAHVELTRDIVRRFNNVYNTDFFKEPQPKLNNCSLICGLDGNKMGKSFNNDIKISDSAEITAKKVMTAITDRSRMRKDDPGHPDECEVAFKYWKIFGRVNEGVNEVETVRCECEKGLRGCADCKRQLGAKINERMAKIRERRTYYEQHPELVEKIIREGSAKARVEAQKILAEVRKLVKMY